VCVYIGGTEGRDIQVVCVSGGTEGTDIQGVCTGGLKVLIYRVCVSGGLKVRI